MSHVHLGADYVKFEANGEEHSVLLHQLIEDKDSHGLLQWATLFKIAELTELIRNASTRELPDTNAHVERTMATVMKAFKENGVDMSKIMGS